MKTTIYDVAKAAGVSITTVSRVINNTGRISDKTRQKVMNVMNEMAYTPNVHAAALTGKRTNMIALVAPDISNPFYGELAKSIEERADELGFQMLICSTDYDPKKETKYFSVLKQKKVDGIIFATGIESHDSMFALEEIASEQIPIAMISQDKPLLPMDIVVIDDVRGGYEAAKHLLSLGHTNIACIIGDGSTTGEKIESKASVRRWRKRACPLMNHLSSRRGFPWKAARKKRENCSTETLRLLFLPSTTYWLVPPYKLRE